MIERSELLVPTPTEPTIASSKAYEAPGIESVVTLEELEREVHFGGLPPVRTNPA